MHNLSHRASVRRTALLGGTVLVSCLAFAANASANGAQATPDAPQAATTTTAAPVTDTAAPATIGVADIVVTAQKRSQRIQDVPISMTASDFTSMAVIEIGTS